MGTERVIKASEMEKMSPDERSRVVNKNSLDSLEGLDPEFRARALTKGRRILAERGLLDTEPS